MFTILPDDLCDVAADHYFMRSIFSPCLLFSATAPPDATATLMRFAAADAAFMLILSLLPHFSITPFFFFFSRF